ncbi:MAG: GAF domain-containing protein [Balneola sp.]|nr:MAG: GAF domain-containing protein [Balneola sp.]
MSLDRQEKALREFKQIMADLVHLLRTSTRVELAYMCWVNQTRQQFVWESNSTNLPNVMFQDRLAFEQHFLDEYKEIKEITKLVIGEDIPKGKLAHYFDFVAAKTMVLIPFINKGETVAITVLETEKDVNLEAINDQVFAYNNALVNVLDTYLEIVDLHEQQKEWEEYEESLAALDYRLHRVDLLNKMLDEMQLYLPNGGACLVCPGMDSWSLVLASKFAKNSPLLGLEMENKSVAYETVEKGAPSFNMHFNNNPKLISSKEKRTEGASLAIPIMIHDRRQAVVITYDSDPLTYKESTKHKLINLARIASLSIQSVVKKSGMAEELFTQNFGAFMTDLWEASIGNELQKIRSGKGKHTWFGLVSPHELSSIRTKYRLEDLLKIQKDFVSFLNPSQHDVPGFIGYNSDYVYAFVIQSDSEDAVNTWMDSVKTKLAHGLKLSNGENLDVSFKAGFTKLIPEDANSYQVLTKAKKALSEVVRNEELELFEA